MAVHNADPAFYALDLDAPDWVEAENGPNNNQSYPTWSIITYHFPAKGDRPAVKMVWYDGGKLPPRPEGLEETRNLGDNGIYFVGDKGCILAGGWSGTPLSTRRRASRQLLAKEASPGFAPYMSRMCLGSLLMSISSGAVCCMR